MEMSNSFAKLPNGSLHGSCDVGSQASGYLCLWDPDENGDATLICRNRLARRWKNMSEK